MPREVDLRSVDDYVSFTLGAEDLPAGARSDTGSLTDRALQVSQLTTEVLGARRVGPPIEFQAELASPPNPLGSATVHLQQQLRGIPVFFGNQIVKFGRSQDLQRTQAHVAVSVVADRPTTVTPETAAEAAVRRLVAERSNDSHSADSGAVGDELSSFSGLMVAEFSELPTRPTVLDKGPLDQPVTASLTWAPVAKELRLCWDLNVAISASEGAFRILVAADDGTIVYCTQTVPASCTASVFAVNPDSPIASVEFPQPWAVYGFPIDSQIPAAPPEWVDQGSTVGYSVRAAVGQNGPPLAATVSNGVVSFNASDPSGPDQMVINAFYGACSMHDRMYLLGFREADGSYQQSGVSASGRPCTKVNVEVRRDPVLGTAHWWPLGRVPSLRLGPESATGRSTALDVTIVFHEYMHGVTSRLVGRGAVVNPFLEPQSRGMSEGWGDYIACTLTNETIIGGWVKNDQRGLRRFPYDESFPVESANFSILPALGQNYYQIGELWCATLMEVNRQIGTLLAIQVVVHALRDLPVNPSLLDGRDTILLALDDRRDAGLLSETDHAAAKLGVWRAFAKFGMGAAAESQGPSLAGIVADSSIPATDAPPSRGLGTPSA
jgi:extracellular elastinolytic metalloproteinase